MSSYFLFFLSQNFSGKELTLQNQVNLARYSPNKYSITIKRRKLGSWRY
jgi:hypothetical protein